MRHMNIKHSINITTDRSTILKYAKELTPEYKDMIE